MKQSVLRVAGGLLGLAMMSGSGLAQDVTLKYAHPTSSSSGGGQMAEKFKEVLERVSDGTMKVQIFPDGQLGGLSEINELVASGAIQVSANTWGSLSVFDEEAGALDAPYIFDSPRQRYEVLTNPNSKIIPQLNEKLAASGSGLRIISSSDGAARQVTCNKAVYSPEDLKGLNFRAIPFPVFIATVKGMGAVPVPIEFAELTTALATGLVACQENPLDTIVHNKLYEGQSHIMLTSHILAGGPMLINAAFDEGLTTQQQSWVREAALAATSFSLESAQAAERDARVQLEELGKVFVTSDDGLDIPAFKAGVAIEMREVFGDKYDRMFAQIEAEKALIN